MKVRSALIILAAAMVMTGCPNRRVGTRLIYVPSPPPAAKPPQPSQGEIVVAQPPPPAAPAKPAPERKEEADSTPVEKAIHPHRAARDVAASASAPATPEAVPGTAEAPPASAPQLAPAGSAQQQVELEKRVGALEAAVQARIHRLSHRRLSSADRKALQDARLFLSEADAAIRQGDLQQSLNLAQKADLLIAAVEKRY